MRMYPLVVLALGACGGEVIGPAVEAPEHETDVPFSVQLTADHLGESCGVRVTAQASGGSPDAYAEWGELTGESYDVDSGTMIEARVQPLHPDVFVETRIRTGDTSWGELDLERFRRSPYQPVVVELEFHYEVRSSAPGDGGTRVQTLIVECT